MIYFDSAYLAKCHLPEPGDREARILAQNAGRLKSVAFAKIEVAAVFTGTCVKDACVRPSTRNCDSIHPRLHRRAHLVLPITPALLDAARAVFQTLPPTLLLRPADCLHLCSAKEAGFKEIYSNDRHLLAAATHFGLRGSDVTA